MYYTQTATGSACNTEREKPTKTTKPHSQIHRELFYCSRNPGGHTTDSHRRHMHKKKKEYFFFVTWNPYAVYRNTTNATNDM